MTKVVAELDLIKVKTILEYSRNEASLKYLANLTNLSYYILKVHLFYLSEYNMISYLGHKHAFITAKEGHKLLSIIYETYQVASKDEYLGTVALE